MGSIVPSIQQKTRVNWSLLKYVLVVTYLWVKYIPGSSRYVTFLPFGVGFWGEFWHKFYTQKEDPGI